MKYIIQTLFLFITFLLISNETVHAQNVQSSPVNFTIKRIRGNDNMNKFKMLIDMELTDAEASFITGIGATSLCSCYCDSLWDAWPDCYPDCFMDIPGTGTLYYMNDGGANPEFPNIPQNGVLGIRTVQGGIMRETDFNVSLKFIVTD